MISKDVGEKYLVLAAKLERAIAQSPPGEKLPSYEALKRRYGVSQATVDRALGVLETKGLIERSRRQGVFLTDPAKRQPLFKGAVDVILPGCGDRWMAGVWSPAIARKFPPVLRANRDAWLSKVLLVLHDELERHGLQFNLMITDWDPRKEVTKLRQSAANPSRGMILLPSNAEGAAEWLEKCAAIKPVVQLFNRQEGVSTDFVGMDNIGAMKLAVRTLVEQGHRTIGMIRNKTMVGEEDRDRYHGYLAGLREAGIEPNPDWELVVTGMDLVSYDREIREHLNTRELPAAFCCQNNTLALLLQTLAQEVGIAIPDRLALIGYGDREVAIGLQPSLSFVVQPSEAVIAAGIDLLAEKIKNPGGGRVQRHVSVEQLVRGGTLGARPEGRMEHQGATVALPDGQKRAANWSKPPDGDLRAAQGPDVPGTGRGGDLDLEVTTTFSTTNQL